MGFNKFENGTLQSRLDGLIKATEEQLATSELFDSFRLLQQSKGDINMDWLKANFPSYDKFNPILTPSQTESGITPLLYGKNVETVDTNINQIHLNLTSISGGGQTSTAKLLAEKRFAWCYSFTTKPISYRRQESINMREEVFPDYPGFTYKVSDQYAHVTEAQFEILQNNGYLIAVKPPEIGWNIKYGVAVPIIKKIADNPNIHQSISVLDVTGSAELQKWLALNYPGVKTLNCFISPLRSWKEILINMMTTRKEKELVPRACEAVSKYTDAPKTSDLIVFNPFNDKSGKPTQAATALFEYACNAFVCV